MKRSQFVSLIAIFAALNAIADSVVGIPQFLSGVWYGWIFLVEPITGIVLGPYAGFLATLIGVMVGHFIYFRGTYEFLFTLGAPMGAMVSGLIFKGKWRWVLIYYTALLAAYFITPVSKHLPIWGMWDTYCAYIGLLVVVAFLYKRGVWKLEYGKLHYTLAICAFIGLEADILFRIFLFIPCQTYWFLYGFTIEALQYIWLGGAIVTPIQVTLSILFTTIVGPQVIKALQSWLKIW